jgi:hypothetical protein
LVHFIEHLENQTVLGDIGHGVTVVLVIYLAVFIDQQHGRYTPKLENVPLLVVNISNGMFGIR